MTLKELIDRFRNAAMDTVEPYLWGDEAITQWLNDAVAEAAVRGRLLHESSNADVCRIAVTSGSAVYPLHPALYELDYIAFRVEGALSAQPVRLVSTEYLDSMWPSWRDEVLRSNGSGALYAVQYEESIRLAPRPKVNGELILEGYRLPLSPMADEEDTPEIHLAHHEYLVHWALHKAFSIPDSEIFDQERADRSEAAFEQYFGPRPDADLRRLTREDVPHHVKAFWV